MSVIIRDMEMPKNCIECSIKSWGEDGYVCPFSGIMALNVGRQDDCPLEEVIDLRVKDDGKVETMPVL